MLHSSKDLIKDAQLRKDSTRRKKAQHLAGIEPTASLVVLRRLVLYSCATAAAREMVKCQGVYSTLDDRTRLTYRCTKYTACKRLMGGWIQLPDPLLPNTLKIRRRDCKE